LKVYNSAGELVNALRDQKTQNGVYEDVYWNGTNMYGEPAASGVYIIYYTNRYQTRMAKFILIR